MADWIMVILAIIALIVSYQKKQLTDASNTRHSEMKKDRVSALSFSLNTQFSTRVLPIPSTQYDAFNYLSTTSIIQYYSGIFAGTN